MHDENVKTVIYEEAYPGRTAYAFFPAKACSDNGLRTNQKAFSLSCPYLFFQTDSP